jgi:hypothetical protein
MSMADIVYSAAYPKSGITYLNFMLFHALFDAPGDAARIDSDYIIDIHENLARVPAADGRRHFVKTHFSYDPAMPLHERAERAICLVRDPIDVMMSIWDFIHLMGHPSLLDGAAAEKEAIFRNFVARWVTTGGDQVAGAGTWVSNVTSWLDQRSLPVLLVRYEGLRADPVAQLARICTFLGAAVPPERIVDAAHRSAAGEMRKQEQREIDSKQAGAFYRPELETGYSRGFRFVGRLNQNSYDTVLTDAERREADRVFGPVRARVAILAR